MNPGKAIQSVNLSGRLRRGGTGRARCTWAARVRWRFTFLAIGLTLAPAAQAETVRMLRVVVVTDNVIRLADVAELIGFEAALAQSIGDLRVAPAPSPGARRTIEQSHVRDVLRAARVNLAAVSLMGVTRTEVSRPAAPASALVNINATRPNTYRTTPRADEPTSEAHVTLASKVRDYFKQRLAGAGGQVEVTFSNAVHGALELASPRFAFRIRAADDRQLGVVTLQVEVFEDDTRVQTVPLVVRVTLAKPVVVASRAINRGEVIRAADHLATVQRVFTRMANVAQGTPATFNGSEARRFIAAGDRVTAKDVKPRTLIKRNDRISVTLRRAGLTIRTVAKARQAGSHGRLIEVINETSRKRYTVRITGPGEAEAVTPETTRIAAGPSWEIQR